MKRILLFLSFSAIMLTGCPTGSHAVNILPRSSWHALPPKPFAAHVPVRITIYHEGEFLNPDSSSADKILKTQIWGMGKDRNWSDIPYHFLIDLRGNVFEGRNVYTAGETNTTYDPSGHLLITAMGNFEEQKISDEQLNSMINLIAYCCDRYQIAPETIKGHKDYAETLCPGKDLYRYLEDGTIIKRVKEVLKSEYNK